MHNMSCIKYQDALNQLLNKSTGETIFTYHDVDLDNSTLRNLYMRGFITRVGRKRVNKQRINTYRLTVVQRLKIKEMLESL